MAGDHMCQQSAQPLPEVVSLQRRWAVAFLFFFGWWGELRTCGKKVALTQVLILFFWPTNCLALYIIHQLYIWHELKETLMSPEVMEKYCRSPECQSAIVRMVHLHVLAARFNVAGIGFGSMTNWYS